MQIPENNLMMPVAVVTLAGWVLGEEADWHQFGV